MKPLEIVRNARAMHLTSKDGEEVLLGLVPGLSESEMKAFEASLPCPLPGDIRELLAFCTGFAAGPAQCVDFTGRSFIFEAEAEFPHGLPIAADGYGNFWVVDLVPDSKAWGPIYFACHDPPVILFQSPTLDHFLVELFKCNTPPFKSLVDDVRRHRLYDVWRKNPGVLSYEMSLASQDPDLTAFARELGPSFQFIDLRDTEIGFGFSWGRYGADTVVRRLGSLPIFAYEKRMNPLRKLLRWFGQK
jgi:hypothetical protein